MAGPHSQENAEKILVVHLTRATKHIQCLSWYHGEIRSLMYQPSVKT